MKIIANNNYFFNRCCGLYNEKYMLETPGEGGDGFPMELP